MDLTQHSPIMPFPKKRKSSRRDIVQSQQGRRATSSVQFSQVHLIRITDRKTNGESEQRDKGGTISKTIWGKIDLCHHYSDTGDIAVI